VKHIDELKALDIQVLGISVDPPEQARTTVERLHTPFPILSDSNRKVMELYGTRSPVYKGPEGGTINTPTLILIDRTGTIRWIHQSPDYRVRAPISDVLVEARKLK